MRLAMFSTAAAALALAAVSPSLCFADDGAIDPAAGGGGAPEPAPPAAKPGKAPKGKKAVAEGDVAHVVWAMPGHHQFAIGTMVKTDAATADALRGAGQARLATDAEVAEHDKHGRPIYDLG